MGHPLHEKIGKALGSASLAGCELVRDKACGGSQHIPLFAGAKSNATEYCKVDILILKERHVYGIIEIEESSIQPIQIFGKFMASALASCYQHEHHGDVPIQMSDRTFFLQVVDSSKLEDGSSKRAQFRNVEQSIWNVMPLPGSKITTYKLIAVDWVNKPDQIEKLVQWVEEEVSASPR